MMPGFRFGEIRPKGHRAKSFQNFEKILQLWWGNPGFLAQP
jgi:hypothetical protein